MFAFSIISILLLSYYQISLATTLRNCSPIESLQYSLNSSGVWKVSSESMYPLLDPGDMVSIEKSTGFLDVQIGDIIVFREPIPTDNESGAIISRVLEIITDPVDQLVFVTKGDANSGSIPGIDFPIYEKDFIGVVDCLLEAGSE